MTTVIPNFSRTDDCGRNPQTAVKMDLRLYIWIEAFPARRLLARRSEVESSSGCCVFSTDYVVYLARGCCKSQCSVSRDHEELICPDSSSCFSSDSLTVTDALHLPVHAPAQQACRLWQPLSMRCLLRPHPHIPQPCEPVFRC